MRASLGLPWKFRIPPKVRRNITGWLYETLDELMGKENLLPRRYEFIHAQVEGVERWRPLGKKGFIQVGYETPVSFDTAIMYFYLALFGMEFHIAIEDMQEEPYMEPIYGDVLEVRRRPDYLELPREGFAYS